ncbi:DUF2933 domain-containing protein [Ramlibacter sp.]|uniref:DUF2933 domain-containing protein n=1 Tax=Ramlibacter sp. TaxID=1917967 RepID=UPI002B7E1177|nr:DUF2933 domain-containing protein [Ramlibacter sp.]HWI83686.1 DUF2933 domain-containing protein [Ramlibacter sp.]
MHDSDGSDSGAGRWKWALIGFLAVAGFFLWTEHKAHLLGLLPYLLVAACPLMHLFHHGHGHGTGRHGSPSGRPGEDKTGAQP